MNKRLLISMLLRTVGFYFEKHTHRHRERDTLKANLHLQDLCFCFQNGVLEAVKKLKEELSCPR